MFDFEHVLRNLSVLSTLYDNILISVISRVSQGPLPVTSNTAAAFAICIEPKFKCQIQLQLFIFYKTPFPSPIHTHTIYTTYAPTYFCTIYSALFGERGDGL